MAAPAPKQISYNAWAEILYHEWGTGAHDYILASGGRAGSKTWEFSQAIMVHGHARSMRICVAREHLKSIEESAYIEMRGRAQGLGLIRPDCYTFQKTAIDHANGTHIFFIGLSKCSEEDIKGLSDVDLVWVEEAQTMSHSSWRLLRPTIRKEGSQIWCSYNPRLRTDAISKFESNSRKIKDKRVYHVHVTFRDNAFFTARSNRDRIADKRANPDEYGHIWKGDFYDVSARKKVLPYPLLKQCVDAWHLRPKHPSAFRFGGLDVADTGLDKNVLALRAGPCLDEVHKWRGSLKFTTSDSARKAANLGSAYGITRMHYDAGGVGAGVRGPFQEMRPSFSVRGQHFGGAVELPDVPFTRVGDRVVTNGEYFKDWSSQAGWLLRLRAMNTQRLVAGEAVDPEMCLFINPKIVDLEDVLAELSQPEYDTTAKLKTDKKPREAGEPEPPSPDFYDGVVLSFSNDLRRIDRFLAPSERAQIG